MKLLFFDVETTGLRPEYHDILTLAMVFEDGKTIDHIHLRIRPQFPRRITPEAEAVHGITREKWSLYDPPEVAHALLKKFLDRYISRFDKKDKAYPVGYNGFFDLQFLSEFFKRRNDLYLGSYINWRLLDPLSWIRGLEFAGRIPPLENHKLNTVAAHFNIDIQAHDALSDTMATRQVFHKCLSLLKRGAGKK